jgi:N-acetylglucosamine-6-sulfatase
VRAALVGVVALAALGASLLPAGGAPAQEARQGAAPGAPNVVLLMTDDQRYDDMGPLEQTRRLIGKAGVTFTRSFVSYPVCCPSRATFFTGQYAHNNHVFCLYRKCGGGRNKHGGYTALDQKEYLPVWLERAGYTTAHIGKFLNGYGKDRKPPDVPRGWTEWYGLIDHSTYRMWGYSMFENGERHTYGNVRREDPALYQTDVLRRKAVDFVRRHANDDAPFFLSVGFLAPHHESGHTQHITGKLVRPAPRHRGRYANAALHKSPNFNEQNLSDKPWFIERWNKNLTPAREAKIVKRMRERQESLLAVDEAVEKVIEELRETDELDNTYVIFTSDHGYMQGEHRIPQGKMMPYDPSTQVPLLIRGPGIPSGRRTKALVGNIDMAPSIVQAARARAGLAMDGRSFLPFARQPRLRSLRPLLHETTGQGARGKTNTREGGAKGQQPRVPAWRAVRTTQWLYVDYEGGQRELYNLTRDPYQLRSVVGDPNLRPRVRTLRRLLEDLSRCRAASCGEIADASVR